MTQEAPRKRPTDRLDADVVILGGGAAGIAAALAASEAGVHAIVVERGHAVGGELVSGLPILGVANTLGEWIVGGPFWTLIHKADALGGYVGRPFDGRTMWGACVDPEVMKLVVVEALAEAGVRILLGASVEEVVADNGHVHGLIAHTKVGKILVTGRCFIDASGDADLVSLAGGSTQRGSTDGTLQPVSLTFRMSHVDYGEVLTWIKDHPDELTLAENPIIKESAAQCAEDIYDSGLPFFVVDGQRDTTLLATSMARGDMYPTTAIWAWPTSVGRQELGFNTTRVSGVDPLNSVAMGEAAATLVGQVQLAVRFMKQNIPGFATSHLSGVAPRIGIRETRRVVGDDTLDTDSVMSGRKRPDGVARGAHHIDIHGSGRDQIRQYIAGGGSYDIPYGALIAAGLRNVLVAGRCLSSTREANGSARVTGTCLATGHAVGVAAALTVDGDTRSVDVAELRDRITQSGGVVEGTE